MESKLYSSQDLKDLKHFKKLAAAFCEVESFQNERALYWNLNDYETSLSYDNLSYYIRAQNFNECTEMDAFVIFLQFKDFDCEIEIYQWSIKEKSKGNGLKFFNEFLSFCKTKGIKRILLEVGHLNTAAIKIYEKCGFRQTARRKEYYKSGEDSLLYEFDNS